MTATALDSAAQAIASAPRRRLLERLESGPATITELAALLDVSVPATLKHVDRLVAGGLATRRKSGRVVTVTLVPGSLDPLLEWARRTRLLWSNHLGRFAAHLGGGTEHEGERR